MLIRVPFWAVLNRQGTSLPNQLFFEVVLDETIDSAQGEVCVLQHRSVIVLSDLLANELVKLSTDDV